MTLVLIVAVPNADNTGLDVDRLERVEDLHPEIARDMLQHGTARIPSDEELAEYHKSHPAEGDETASEAPAEAKPGTFTPRFQVGKGQPAEQPAE